MNITTLTMKEEMEFDECNDNYYIELLEQFYLVTKSISSENERDISLLKEKCLLTRNGDGTLIILSFSGLVGNIGNHLYNELRDLIQGKDEKTIKNNNYIAGSWANSKNFSSFDKADYSFLTKEDDFS